MNKKALGPVVATSLLIVVAVVALVGFQSWFGNYSTQTFSNVEVKTKDSTTNSGIETVIGNVLYFKNNIEDNLSIKSLKVGDKICNVSDLNLSLGVKEIDLGNCTQDLSLGSTDIVIITKNKIFEKKVNLKSNYEPPFIFNFDLNTSFIDYNKSVSLSWNAPDATSCNASGDWTNGAKAVSGSEILNDLVSNSTFTLECTDGVDTVIRNVVLEVGPKYPFLSSYKCMFSKDKSGCESEFQIDGCGSGTVLNTMNGLCFIRNLSQYSILSMSSSPNPASKCLSLNFAGHSDWRLPGRFEVHTILGKGSSNNVIGGADNIFLETDKTNYWTNTKYVFSSNYWRNINFQNSIDNYYQQSNSIYYTCVRNDNYNTGVKSLDISKWTSLVKSEQSRNSADFTINGCGTDTILDSMTNLCWQRDFTENGALKNWTNAKQYCEDLDFAGHSDWRLPYSGEFFSIVDDSTNMPTTAQTNLGFVNVPTTNSNFWTFDEKDSNDAYYISLTNLLFNRNIKSTTYYTICVRHG